MWIKKDFTPTFIDYPDNSSYAISIYFCGCSHGCSGCHSKELKDFYSGTEVSPDELYELIDRMVDFNRTNKLVFIGGDPLFNKNVGGVNNFIKKYGHKYDICIYTGYDINHVLSLRLNSNFKYIKCGTYDINLKQQSFKDDSKMVFASRNQKLYDNKFNLLSTDGIYYF